MTEPEPEVLTEAELKKRLEALLKGRHVKVWLAQSDGAYMDVRFSVGEEQGEAPKLFDFAGGFYLLGEGIHAELLPAIHQLFEQFCRTHRDIPPHARHAPIVVRHHSFSPRYPQHRPRVSMHYPVSFGPMHPPIH